MSKTYSLEYDYTTNTRNWTFARRICVDVIWHVDGLGQAGKWLSSFYRLSLKWRRSPPKALAQTDLTLVLSLDLDLDLLPVAGAGLADLSKMVFCCCMVFSRQRIVRLLELTASSNFSSIDVWRLMASRNSAGKTCAGSCWVVVLCRFVGVSSRSSTDVRFGW